MTPRTRPIWGTRPRARSPPPRAPRTSTWRTSAAAGRWWGRPRGDPPSLGSGSSAAPRRTRPPAAAAGRGAARDARARGEGGAGAGAPNSGPSPARRGAGPSVGSPRAAAPPTRSRSPSRRSISVPRRISATTTPGGSACRMPAGASEAQAQAPARGGGGGARARRALWAAAAGGPRRHPRRLLPRRRPRLLGPGGLGALGSPASASRRARRGRSFRSSPRPGARPGIHRLDVGRGSMHAVPLTIRRGWRWRPERRTEGDLGVGGSARRQDAPARRQGGARVRGGHGRVRVRLGPRGERPPRRSQRDRRVRTPRPAVECAVQTPGASRRWTATERGAWWTPAVVRRVRARDANDGGVRASPAPRRAAGEGGGRRRRGRMPRRTGCCGT